MSTKPPLFFPLPPFFSSNCMKSIMRTEANKRVLSCQVAAIGKVTLKLSALPTAFFRQLPVPSLRIGASGFSLSPLQRSNSIFSQGSHGHLQQNPSWQQLALMKNLTWSEES